MLLSDVCLMSDVLLLSVGHVTRDPDTTFKVKRSKVNLLLMS